MLQISFVHKSEVTFLARITVIAEKGRFLAKKGRFLAKKGRFSPKKIRRKKKTPPKNKNWVIYKKNAIFVIICIHNF